MQESAADLKCCSLFNGLNEQELVRLFDLVESETFASGEDILTQGRVYRSVWVILRGQCEVVRTNGHGTDQQLAVLEQGGIFGEMSFLHEAPHSATVRALSEVEAIHFTPASFEQLKQSDISASLTITSNLVLLLSDRLRRMDAWICEVVEQSEDRQHRAEWREFQSKLYTDWSF
ncbi:MAG: cyclic nucleotide-binding domain-containing protein [Planctomycetaceae bacterium]|nr:cyclic nucleotide-binding domain-containing protein [Planctomycetaceae bacterium]